MLVSDGGDNSSVHRAEDVMRSVLESRATIYTIGIFDEADPDRNPGVAAASRPRSAAASRFLEVQLSDVIGICRQIASDIRSPVHNRLRSGSIRRTGFAAEDQSDRVDARRAQV